LGLANKLERLSGIEERTLSFFIITKLNVLFIGEFV